MTFVRVGSLFLRTGNKVITPPQSGSLVVMPGGGGGTFLQGTIPVLAGGGPGVGLKSVAWLARMKVDEVRAALSPGGIGGIGVITLGSTFSVAISPNGSGFGITSSFLGATNAGPTLGVTAAPLSSLPANGGFIWTYAFIDYTVGGAGNCTIGCYILIDSGTVLIGQSEVATYGSSNPYADPAATVAQVGLYGASTPYANMPGGQTMDGCAFFGSIAGSCQLSGMARNTPPIPYGVGGAPANLLASYGFSNVLTPDQPGLVAPLVPTALAGATPSVVFIPGGIFN